MGVIDSPVWRQRLRVVVIALVVFGSGIGATRAWDAWQQHQAQHAAWPALVNAINVLMSHNPAAAADFQRLSGAAAVPAPPPPVAAAAADPPPPADPDADAPATEEDDADDTPIDPG